MRDTDHEAMLRIQELLDGVEWNSQTLDDIAGVMIRAGYTLHELDGTVIEEPDYTKIADDDAAVCDDCRSNGPQSTCGHWRR